MLYPSSSLVSNAIRSVLISDQTVVMVVKGASMLPYLKEGNRVWLQLVKENQLEAGDLVAFEFNQVIFTHRVIKKGSNLLLTKGDNSIFPDPPITIDQVLGKVIAFERDGKVCPIEEKSVIINRVLGYAHYGIGLLGQVIHMILKWTQGRLRKPLFWIGRGVLLPLRLIERVLIYAS